MCVGSQMGDFPRTINTCFQKSFGKNIVSSGVVIHWYMFLQSLSCVLILLGTLSEKG